MKKLFLDKDGKIKIIGLNSPFFYYGLIIKLICSLFFASNYLYTLFGPFINYFAYYSSNPYNYFYKQGIVDAFPYPALMLWLTSSAKTFFAHSNYLDVSNFDLLLYRLPLLCADLAILLILLRWLKAHTQKVLIFYWLSPISIYITYIDGQFDVLPTALFFISLYFLFKERPLMAILFLSLALACKTHIILTIPFFILYLFKARYFKNKLHIFSLFLIPLIFVLINSPYLLNQGFQNYIFHNAQQTKFFELSLIFNDHTKLYLVLFFYLLLFFYSLNFKSFSRDLFVMFVGFCFGIFILLIPPMPGWYFWVLPFFVYFYIKQHDAQITNFFLLNVVYFFYFAISPDSVSFEVFQPISKSISAMPNLFHQLENAGFNSLQINNITFTFLQAVLLLNCHWIHRQGVLTILSDKIKIMPYFIGISGDSGTGKTICSDLLAKVFNVKNTTIICGDDMHKYERGHAMWKVHTHLNPKANHLHQDRLDALKLKQGLSINRLYYNHDLGKFSTRYEIQPNKVMIFEGLHTLFLKGSNDIYDLKIFVNPDQQLRQEWKIKRDVEERSKTEESVIQQIQERQEDSEKYIQIQKQNADLVISFRSNESGEINLLIECDNNIHIEPLLQSLLQSGDLVIEHEYNIEKQSIIFSGGLKKEALDFIANDLVPELDETIICSPAWQDGYNGIIQIFTVYFTFQKLRLDSRTQN